ncbi:tetratricopeptide repeat protein [Rhodococcus sp. D-46]|uniref:tetratricopeptide repeat protein n=1 Tax=Rhodococcus sp. D-46 TaxID=2716265 RepID=UPI0013F62426|nr:tetratricopeptide repeat protein [Rhodococcus sp. D-46]
MPIELSGRPIFLASPGNLAHERDICRKTVSAFNEERANPARVHFLVRGWEQFPAGVGRPQARINPYIDDCDFMILMLGDHWGSPPSLDGPYSSGTEEEFHRCLELLGSADACMRDLLVLFKTVDAGRLRDPGPQLCKVMDFRDRLEQSKGLLFDTFDSDDSLSGVITRNLVAWSAQPLGARVPQTITLQEQMIPVEPSDSIPMHELSDSTPMQLLETAKKKVAAGHLMQAEAAFSHAIKDGDPEALTEYAQFMRRTGRLEQALILNNQLLKDPALLARDDAEAVAYRTNSLANMGVIHRKRGELTQSRDLLHEAVETARASAEPINQKLCYALDNYGLTLLKIAEPDAAVQFFEEAHTLRENFGSPKELAQSAINLGRSQMNLGNYAAAESRFAESVGLLGGDYDDHLMANALSGLAESVLRQDISDGVRAYIEKALGINERIQNSDGVSIAHALFARLLVVEGSLTDAEKHALVSQEKSEKSNNAAGLGTATWLLAEVAFAKGETSRARGLLREAKVHAGKAQSVLLDRDIEQISLKLSVAGA